MKDLKGKHFAPSTKSKSKVYPCLLLIAFVLIVICINGILAYFMDTDSSINSFSIEAEYIVAFDANGGDGSMDNQSVSYNVSTSLNLNSFTRDGYMFSEWNTEADGSGDAYSDGHEVFNLVGNNNGVVTLYAQWEAIPEGIVAEINGTFYETLQAAVDAVPTDDTETTIRLLKNLNESITVTNGKNIVFNLQNYTLSYGKNEVIITNTGSIKIYNGTIFSDASQGAINNNANGKIVMTGGKIITTGDRQAIYNNGGTVEISGNAYLSSSASGSRGTVQNQSTGTLTITGGTIISTNQYAVYNIGTMTIGVKDGTTDANSPEIVGANSGIASSANFNYYDGIIKGKNSAINNESRIADKETGYSLLKEQELINGETYKTVRLAIVKTVTFDANGGNVSETTRNVFAGGPVGNLPTPTNSGYAFEGWFTSSEDGDEVDATTIITEDVTFYAHWRETRVALMNGTRYQTVQDAVNAAPVNTETTIELLNDSTEAVIIPTNKNIIVDLTGHTMSNNGNNRVFVNNGILVVKNGNMNSSAGFAAIDNNPGGTLVVDGVRIETNGVRQTVYNDKGTVYIQGDTYLSTTSSERATVWNLAGGTINITGGTIISGQMEAVDNEGTLNIGSKDGSINSSIPNLQGSTYGVKNTGTFNFYDGILKGKTGTVNGVINEIEDGSTEFDSSENIEGENYYTKYLSNN